MGQQHDQSAEAVPFLLSRADELVDDHLGIVGEIPELGFPQHQGVGIRGGITVFKGQHGLLRQQGVGHQEIGLVFADVAQWHIGIAILLAIHHRMAMEEGATPAVLPGKPNGVAFMHQGSIGHGFGKTPVHGHGARRHLVAVGKYLGHAGMKLETARQAGNLGGQLADKAQIHTGIRLQHTFRAHERRPCLMAEIGRLIVVQHIARHTTPGVQSLAVGILHGPFVIFRDDALADEPAGIDLPRRGQALDFSHHHGLGHGWLVDLAVPMTAVADQVDDHVLTEFHAVIQRQLANEQNRLRVIAVDVKYGGIHHFRHVAAIQGGTGILLVAGGESDLVVDDDVDGALGGITTRLGHVEGFHHHPLPGKRRVAMDQHRYHLRAVLVLAPLLAGSGRPLHHRIDDLQVGRVESQ